MKGLKLSRFCPVLHHVLFADDTVIFGSATTSEAKAVQVILDRYCYVSGQAINKAKSSILFPTNTPSDIKNTIASEFGVDFNISMGNYLGVPAEWGATKKQTFQYMLDRLTTKVNSWHSSVLSHAGRSVLVKSVLQALPSYLFSCFLLPKHILRRMDQLLANFWWSRNGSSSKVHWLPAAELRKSISDGGLGFRSFYEFNLAFIAKLAWKVLINPNSLWHERPLVLLDLVWYHGR
ncbi:Putative ribonuclease H protein At1g65750 [Linum perenne]